MSINVNLGTNSYDIIICRGALKQAGKELNLNRKVFIITDDGVPGEYSKCIADQCKEAHVFSVLEGEDSKSIATYEMLLSKMLSLGFDRNDCVVAVGGGVVGDLSGFVAASYMRGIDFYNIPTTILSQIDSSIGGKVAINLDGIKNIVGAFYQPKKVLIDPDVLSTLSPRQISNGLSEAVKMSLTSDAELFSLFENEDVMANIEKIIKKSLMIKKKVVEEDEKEKGLRKVLNFGHTIGHGIEAQKKLGMYHGECVALGMLPMCSKNVRNRLKAVLSKLSLPTCAQFDTNNVMSAISHDKKANGEHITTVYVEEIGSFLFKEMSLETLRSNVESLM